MFSHKAFKTHDDTLKEDMLLLVILRGDSDDIVSQIIKQWLQ